MTTITNKITSALLQDLIKEAHTYDPDIVQSKHLSFLNNYLKDMYNIYIKSHTHWGETTYYNTLAFYAKCPDYKKVRRHEFLKKHGAHFNCVVLPMSLSTELKNEYNNDLYYMTRVCLAHKAWLVPPTTARCRALIFKDERRYQLFKLKYSEYL